MNIRRRSRWLSALIFAGVLMLNALAATAQEKISNYDEQGDPANVNKLELERPYKAWALIGVFFVGCLALTFKSSKRTHLD